MSLSHDKKLLASCSPDDIVKIIDVSHLASRPKDGSFDLEAYEQGLCLKPNHGKVEPKKRTGENMSGDWSDASDSDGSDSDSDEDMDSSDENEAADTGKHKKKNKQLNPKKATLGMSKKMVE
jgi:hypothetical protein